MMLELEYDQITDRGGLIVQDEPALEIALPQVFEQPALTVMQRGKLPHVEALAARIFRTHQANPGGALGEEYQALVTEFQPLFAWSISCWDFVLSTEGCRFLPRHSDHRIGVRGDYRAVNEKDFSRLVHATFRRSVLEFTQHPEAPSLPQWLREQLWPRILAAYRQLENPPDPRQRRLTAYSYLRCSPYHFLNEFHQHLVYTTLHRLPSSEWEAINAYFLHFFTEEASAGEIGCSVQVCTERLRQALIRLLTGEQDNRLVYCLLRQIERY